MKNTFIPDNRLDAALSSFSRFHVPLKIVVKARDELELTRSWIEHHAGIVGLENILIADNDSSIPEVFDIYRSFGPTLSWFSFVGYHENVLRARAFPQLYQVLKTSCQYVAFIDMDERLLCFCNESWHADEGIIRRLACTSAPLISAPWLQNTPGRDNQFDLYPQQLEWGVSFGKPLVANSNPSLGTGRNHTIQYPVADADFLGLGVLHLSLLSATQRLRTNKNKLIKAGVAVENATYEEIAAIPTNQKLPSPLVTVRCIEEIRSLLDSSRSLKDIPSGDVPPERTITLAKDNRLEFGSFEVRSLFTDFLCHERAYSLNTLPTEPKFVS